MPRRRTATSRARLSRTQHSKAARHRLRRSPLRQGNRAPAPAAHPARSIKTVPQLSQAGKAPFPLVHAVLPVISRLVPLPSSVCRYPAGPMEGRGSLQMRKDPEARRKPRHGRNTGPICRVHPGNRQAVSPVRQEHALAPPLAPRTQRRRRYTAETLPAVHQQPNKAIFPQGSGSGAMPLIQGGPPPPRRHPPAGLSEVPFSSMDSPLWAQPALPTGRVFRNTAARLRRLLPSRRRLLRPQPASPVRQEWREPAVFLSGLQSSHGLAGMAPQALRLRRSHRLPVRPGRNRARPPRQPHPR